MQIGGTFLILSNKCELLWNTLNHPTHIRHTEQLEASQQTINLTRGINPKLIFWNYSRSFACAMPFDGLFLAFRESLYS